MKPEEAIEELNHELLIRKCLIEEVNSFICDCDVDDDEYDDEKEQFEIGLTRYKKEKEVIEMAISAIKELQQYHEIGTVEECRKAAEKQKPKKPKLNYKPRFLGKATYTCPKCGNCCLEEFANERQNNNYCWDCGQAIRWDENLEETENEQIKFGVLL